MNADAPLAHDHPSRPDEHWRAVTAVARVARALVAGGLDELGGDALGAIAEALDLDVVAMYVPEGGGSPDLRLFTVWPANSAPGRVRNVLPLEPDAWRFLVSSAGPLVLRQREASILDNPFRPPADSWVAIPLIARSEIEGAVFGSSSTPISLGPVTRSTLGSIADLLSAGVATARLRLEAQRTEIQRERLTLVAELHDGLAQDLALAVREVAFMESDPPPEAARASAVRLGEAVRAAHRLVRAELEDLASGLPEPGLAIAARAIIDRFALRGLTIDLDEDLNDAAPSAALVAVLLRVLNEALSNVEQHAHDAHAAVTIRADNKTLVMCIIDHGVGVDAAALPTMGDGHFGIAIMRARAMSVGGALNISGGLGTGTKVELRVPLDGVAA